jgi:hypothetical protein
VLEKATLQLDAPEQEPMEPMMLLVLPLLAFELPVSWLLLPF